MSATTRERTSEHPTWICDNCHAETPVLRKRCAQCGTSRY